MTTIWLICSSRNSFAALPATLVWEARTTGATTGGGAFASDGSGTDFSQQDAAQRSWLSAGGTYTNDLSCTNAAPSVCTSASYNFAAADVGNVINLTAGTSVTAGRYHIASVATNAATLDRNAMTAAGAADASGYEGGAVDHPNTISTIVIASNTVYIQNGTYVKVGANTYILACTIDNITWIGYITNHSTIPTGTDRPVFDGDSDNNGTDDTADCIVVQTGMDDNLFKNLILKNGTTSAFNQNINTSEAMLVNVLMTSSVDGVGGLENIALFNCEIDNNTDAGRDGGGNRNDELYYTYVHDNANEGFHSVSNASIIVSYYSIYDSNAGMGLGSADTGYIEGLIGNIFYNNTGASSDGVFWNGGSSPNYNSFMHNNSSIDNGRYGFNRGATTDSYPSAFFDYNNYNGNGTAGLNNLTAGVNDNTTNPVFTGEATGDFTLSTGSDTALLGLGFPQTATNGLTGDYNVNIGVDQSKAAGAGGCSDAFGVIQ